MHEYTCPECSTVLRSKTPAPKGKKIRCKHCAFDFEPGAVAAEVPTSNLLGSDTEAYGIAKEPESTSKEKPIKFEAVEEKFKRSTRGPAMALMVLPTNLLLAQGALTFIGGIVIIIYGIFPLVFTDVEPSEDEYREQFGYILFGFLAFLWGCLICLGASRAQNLESYTWAWVGAVAGIPAGIFSAVMLRNPKVIAGFQEMEGALDEDEDGIEKEDEDADEDDEDEDDDED